MNQTQVLLWVLEADYETLSQTLNPRWDGMDWLSRRLFRTVTGHPRAELAIINNMDDQFYTIEHSPRLHVEVVWTGENMHTCELFVQIQGRLLRSGGYALESIQDVEWVQGMYQKWERVAK